MYLNFVRSMIMGQPFQPMFEVDGAGGGTPNDPPSDPTDPQDPPSDDPQDPPSDDDKVEFSEAQQKFIDSLINKTIAKERKKAEQKAKEDADRQKMSDDEKKADDLKKAEEKIQETRNTLLNYEIKDVARDMGIPSKKLDRFLKIIDREGLMDEEGTIDRKEVESAVKAVLGDFPEFKASDSNKGPADFSGGGGGVVKYSMAQIQAMSPKEIADNYDEVTKSIQFHQNKK